MGRRGQRALVVVLLVLAMSPQALASEAIVLPPPMRAIEAVPKGELAIGQSLFWDGEFVADAHGGATSFAYFFAPSPATDPCVNGTARCWRYQITVAEAGGSLRVALDSSNRGDCFGFELLDPNGERRAFPAVCQTLPQSFDIEATVADAAKGTWEVKVVTVDVKDWAFRMRAALEGPRPKEPRLLEPNLVVWLPWEFGFVAPVNPNAGSAPDFQNPPGPPGISCHSQESASKCLRFSTGVYNTGDGPLYLDFREDQAFQHVFLSDDTPGYYGDNEADGNYVETAAGPAEFHDAHGHRHFEGMVLYELFDAPAPADPPPYDPAGRSLERIGEGNKHGYCTFSQRFEDWFSFEQDDQLASLARHPDGTRAFDGFCNEFMPLERGWGDVYRWQRPGQYVPYDAVADGDGTMRAGYYVVRVTVDPDDRLTETNEHDNVGYAYIQVIDGDPPNGDRVVMCEQGFGDSPWDPRKEIAEDSFLWAHLLRDPDHEAERC